MALYRPVATTADLPASGAGRETGVYDFKESVNPEDARELAKDVAAFANATGGVILVGAEENKETGTLKRYRTMPEAFAERVKAAYDRAVAELCRPQPVIDAVRLKAPAPFDDGYVVAVNVSATPLSPVGVRWVDDPKCPPWAFPLRATTHTTFLTPTELPMLMVPQVRRIAVALDSIPMDERVDLEIVCYANSGGPNVIKRVKLLGIDDRMTTLRIAWSQVEGRPAVTSTLPLDRVTSVWQREERHWSIVVDGRIVEGGDRLYFAAR